MLQKKVLKAGIGYTVGNILIKGISFLTLPLFSRIMTTAEFGLFNVFISYDSIIFVIIGMALHSSVRNANLTFEGKINDYVSSITLIYIFNLIILFIGVYIFGERLSSLLGLPCLLLYFLIIHSFCSAIFTLYNTRISLDYSYLKYLLVSVCNCVGNVGLSLLFIFTIFKNDRVLGRISGTTLTSVLIALFILFYFYKQSRPRFEKKFWSFGIKYSLPIIPHGISQVLLSQFDRIMINSMVSAASAGIYSLAGNLKIILTVISDSISTVWTTWFYEQAKDNNIASIQKRATSLSFLFLCGSIILCGISPELIILLGGQSYSEGKFVAIPMIIDAFVLFLYNIIVPSEYYKKKTVYIMLGTFIAAVINIITNYVFIRKYGYIAAAYTTLFSYLCYLIFHIIISRIVFGIFVLKISYLVSYFLILIFVAVYNIIFINQIIIRYILIFAVFMILCIYLIYYRRKGKYKND